jgi:hypothetical protein
VARKPKPVEELPDDYRQIIHLACSKRTLMNLDTIVKRHARDPLLGPMKGVEVGREQAARYAIAYCAEHGPARISTTD